MSKAQNKKLPFDVVDWQSFQPSPVIGVDEVGRGCLAGPVYAAAVIINPLKDFSHFTDSKLLSEVRREEMLIEIQMHHQVSIGFATIEEIERLNILNASLLAMRRAVEGLGVTSGHVLVDGNQKIKGLSVQFTQTTLIKGDLRAAPISAASIAAKVTRDKLMAEKALMYSHYGFERHKGYATEEHRQAITKYGPCPEHRKTFAGVKEFLVAAGPSL